MATSSNFAISLDHLDELKYAKALLENPSLAAKMTDYLGTPIELFMDKLPSNWNQKLSGVTHSALNKAAAQAVPAIGAVGGAAINTLFIDHFQDMAKGHFIVRKLERKYGENAISQQYKLLPK